MKAVTRPTLLDAQRRLLLATLGGPFVGCAAVQPTVHLSPLSPVAGAVAGPWPRSLMLDVDSRHTGQRYRLIIGLPLAPPPPAGYPVLWALDGMASFPIIALERRRTPTAQDSDLLRQREQHVPDGLVVGIGYASGEPFDLHSRALDYTPAGDGETGDRLSPRHGGSAAFTRFLTEELRTLIAAAWPLDPAGHTLFGFSYGGLFAVQLLCRAPQHFQRWWAASPSLWFRGHSVLSPWGAGQPVPDFRRHPVSVQLTVGEHEQFPPDGLAVARREQLQARRMVDNMRGLHALLQRQTGVDARLLVMPGHDHLDMLAHGARGVFGFAFNPPKPERP